MPSVTLKLHCPQFTVSPVVQRGVKRNREGGATAEGTEAKKSKLDVAFAANEEDSEEGDVTDEEEYATEELSSELQVF